MQAAIRAAGAEATAWAVFWKLSSPGCLRASANRSLTVWKGEIAHLAFAIPAVKALSLAGLCLADCAAPSKRPVYHAGRQSGNNRNKNGSINGGIAGSMPIVFRTAVKPTPSIYKDRIRRIISPRQMQNCRSGPARSLHCAPCCLWCRTPWQHLPCWPPHVVPPHRNMG